MKHSAPWLAFLLCCAGAMAQDQPSRPKIFGIAEVRLYSTNVAAARDFYRKVLSPMGPCLWCEQAPRYSLTIPLSASQLVIVSSAPASVPSNLLAEVVFAIDDVSAMKRFLTARKVSFAAPQGAEEGRITLGDPEGHGIAFAKQTQASPQAALPAPGLRLIHVGLIVHDRAATDHFYKDILGFRSYWHGGMKDDQDDWVAMQVPDGSDWVEYMLNISPTADKQELGVMNHIALGVRDIQAEKAQLLERGWKPGEEPQMGRDGKWQLNVYDPDFTRIEFMEYLPVQKPCCSKFTGPHPKP